MSKLLVITLLIFTSFFSSCTQSKEKKTDTIKKTQFDTTTKIANLILVSSAQLLPYTKTMIDNCNFSLVTNNKDTIYLCTYDKNFKTPEGYSVGFKFSDLSKEIKTNLTKEPGWGYYFKLPSGWSLGFCEGNSCTENYPKKNSFVKWIFKRK